MPLRSLSPRNSGFIQLSRTRSRSDAAMHDDIPLSTIKSTASTGARREHQINAVLSDSGSDEKRHTFHRGPRRHEAPARAVSGGSGGADEVSLNPLGRLYARIIGYGASLRYLIYIVPVGLALAVPLIVLALTGRKEDIPVGRQKLTGAGGDEVEVRGPPLFRIFLWVEIAWLTIWAGKLVAFLLPPVFMFLCGVVSSGTRKYATVLRNLTIPLSLFFWALASWITFRELFRQSKDAGIVWVRDFERVLGASFASSAVYLGEKAIVQIIGITYHQRSFANRIKESKAEVRLLGLLLDASRALFPMYCPEFADEDYVINDSIEVRLAGGRVGKAVPMRRIVGDVGRLGDKVTSVFGNIASEITGKKVFNPNSAHSVVVEALEKTKSSEALGRRIWMSFAIEGRESLLPDDIAEVLGPEHKHEAEDAFAVLDVDENGDVSLDEMVRKVVDIGKERKAIGEGMKDISQALQVFDQVLLFMVLLIVIFIFLAFFQSSFITTLATAGTALLSLSFVFAVTTQEFLGSCIFLFVKHPYDVGDRVDMMVLGEKLPLQVERISLLYTVFVRIDKMQVVQTPNIQLNNLWIENVTRSNAMREYIRLNVSYDTSFEDVELLRVEMEAFVRAPENARDFQPDFTIGVASVGDLDKLQLEIAIRHKSNWHNEAIRLTRRSKFICALATAVKKIPIYPPGGGSEGLGSVGNPSYAVTVSDAEAAANREQADRDKEALRMVPSAPADADAAAAAGTGVVGGDNNSNNNNNNNNNPASGRDWFDRDDKAASAPDGTRLSLESSRSGLLPNRGESQNRGLRRAGETLETSGSRLSGGGSLHRGESQSLGLRRAGDTLETSGSRSGSLHGGAPGSVRRSASRRRYDEEAQVGSPTTPLRGGFLAPAGAAPMMTPVQEVDNPYQLYPPEEQERQDMQGQGAAAPPRQPPAGPPGGQR